MASNLRRIVAVAVLLSLASMGLTAQVQGPNRGNTYQVRTVLNRIATRTDSLKTRIDSWITTSSIDGTRAEDNIKRFMSDFEDSLARVRDNFDQRQSTSADVQDLLDKAARIDNFFQRRQPDARLLRDWANLRADLNTLGGYYGVSWRSYTGGNRPPVNDGYRPPVNDGYRPPVGGSSNRLTGTYRLDVSHSDDPRSAADRATRTLPYGDRQTVLDSLTARLEAPDQIAIDRRGRSITIASTRAPQITFEADGQERIETTRRGATVRARATLNGDQLLVSTTGDRDNDFTVTFDPIDNGQRLTVIRRVNSARLAAPVVVQSVYNRTSDVAQLDIYRGGSGYPGSETAGGEIVIPDNTPIVAVLNNDLTTRATQNNDRFTMTVKQPYQYQGAVIEGYVSGISRSGKVSGRSGMTLNFDTIRLRDGRSYKFAGLLESVRPPNGETVRVDNEGTVEDKNSKTNTTVERAAIGTAVGAIIGAIAGGGKGAAIGAVVGAGAGAGSVYVQGKDDLDLLSGTEVTIRSTGPR